LVQGPYVDAMPMFRRDVLLELGGYDHTLSEIGWFGWEDCDMWLRFAQQDLHVGFVPNILCLYRQHETSMINTTNLFAHDSSGCFKNATTRSPIDSPPARNFSVSSEANLPRRLRSSAPMKKPERAERE